MTIKLPPSAKLRRQARSDGGYEMVPAYTADEVIAIIRAREEVQDLKNLAAFNAGREYADKAAREVNINDYVRLKLTDAGRAHLVARHDELVERVSVPWPYIEPQVDEDGYSKFQLWDAMNTFGPLCTLGSGPPFATGILIGGAA